MQRDGICGFGRTPREISLLDQGDWNTVRDFIRVDEGIIKWMNFGLGALSGIE
jgi:hypothetical protein